MDDFTRPRKKLPKSTLPSALMLLFSYYFANSSESLYGSMPDIQYLLIVFALNVIQIVAITILFKPLFETETMKFKVFGLNGENGGIPKLFIGLALGILAFLAACAPLYITGDYVLSSGVGSFTVPFAGLLSFITVGYTEEFLCRGFIQHRLLKFGPIKALLITSGVFSLLHLANPNFSIPAFINIFLAGTFMGAALYAGKGLLMPIGIHITWNWVQGSVLGIPVSGLNQSGYYSTEIAGSNWLLTGGEFGGEGSVYCTIALVVFTALLMLYAHKTGRIKYYAELGKLPVKSDETSEIQDKSKGD